MRNFILCLSILSFSLAGCGGGGGGGGGGSAGGSGATPVPDVLIGTVAFNPASSQALDAHPFAFPIGNAWSWKQTDTYSGVPTTYAVTFTQSFSTTTITVGATVLPCYLVTYLNDSSHNYSIWATATNGGIYNLTHENIGLLSEASVAFTNPPPITTQPLLILPPAPSVTSSWAGGCTGYALGYDNGYLGRTRNIMSMSTTSPGGFTGCMQMQIINPATPSLFPTYEYWKPGYGIVEVLGSDAAHQVDIYRIGIAFSG